MSKILSAHLELLPKYAIFMRRYCFNLKDRFIFTINLFNWKMII